MSFDQLFAIAIAVTASAGLAIVLITSRELRSRKAQRHDGHIFTPAGGLIDSDEGSFTGQNSELLHAISRLG